MKRLLAILILLVPSFCWASVLSSSVRTTRAKTAVDSVPLSSSVRHGASGGYANAWDDYWTLDGSNGLYVADNAILRPNSDDWTIIVGFEEDNNDEDYYGIFCKGDDVTLNNAEIRAYETRVVHTFTAGTSVSGGTWQSMTVAGGEKVNTKTCALISFLWDSGSSNYELTSHVAISGEATVSTGPLDKWVNNGTSTLYFGSLYSSGSTSLGLQGKLYFIAIYDGSVLTKTNAEDILAGTAEPTDFSPAFYVDFHKDVAATYESEISGLTLTVYGTPVKGP